MAKEEKFDFERFKKEAAERLKEGGELLGTDGVLTPLLKEFLEESLEGELDAHLEEDKHPNRKNGKGKKRIRTSQGQLEIQTPRDRNSSFEPRLVAKRSKNLGGGLDRQIIALYARGSSYSDIRDYLLDMYGIEASTAMISRVTDKTPYQIPVR